MKFSKKLTLIKLKNSKNMFNFCIAYKLKSMSKTKNNQAVSKMIVRKPWKTVQNYKDKEMNKNK